MTFLDEQGLARLWTHIVAKLGAKVDKVSGKGLSTNDFTTEEKNKLAGIAEGANNTVVDAELSNTSANPVQNAVVSSAIEGLGALIGDKSVSEQIATAIADIPAQEQAQSDWNQNDESASDYVKNRTHYSEYSVITLVPECSVTIGGSLTATINGTFIAEVDKTYYVTFQGVEYKCVGYPSAINWVMLGNDALYGGSGMVEYADYPFNIISYGDGYAEICTNALGTFTVSITEKEETVHQLDSKYIPSIDLDETIYVDKKVVVGATKDEISENIAGGVVVGDGKQLAFHPLTNANSISRNLANAATICASRGGTTDINFMFHGNPTETESTVTPFMLISDNSSIDRTSIATTRGNLYLKSSGGSIIISGEDGKAVLNMQDELNYDPGEIINVQGITMVNGTKDFRISVDSDGMLSTTNVGDGATVVFANAADVPNVDSTLAVDGAAADAKVTGDAISNLNTLVGDTSVSDQITAAISAIQPKCTSITLTAANWTGDSNPWSQVVAVNGVTANSKVDLQPTAVQIVELQNNDIALMAENDNGVITVYALGSKPTVDYTMQALITEVVAV